MMETNNQLNIATLGTISYEKAWDMQQELHASRIRDEIPDTLLLLEHTPVITLGTRGSNDDLLVDTEEITRRGVSIHRATRGGQATLHSPGQLVGYFICNVRNIERKVRMFVTAIEDSLIQTLKKYNVDGQSVQNHPGIWIKDKKIASIGLSISKATTMHGFALNCTTDLGLFSLLSPCGLEPSQMCSIESIRPSGTECSVAHVIESYITHGIPSFGYADTVQTT